MRARAATVVVTLACVVMAVGCGCRRVRPDATTRAFGPLAAKVLAGQSRRDLALEQCRERITTLLGEPVLDGAPERERRRIELLGRAKGEPVIFVREPAALTDDQLPERLRPTRQAAQAARPRDRVALVLKRHGRDPEALRALLLREGYLYSNDPDEAVTLVKGLELPKLFTEATLWLQRGAHLFELRRSSGRQPDYRFVDGPLRGANAELLLADRVAVRREELGEPLHRDLRPLGAELGFERTRVEQLRAKGIVAELRFGSDWARALLTTKGADVALGCLDAPAEVRARIDVWQRADAPRRRALGKLHEAVTAMVVEKLPFDRPRKAKDHWSDGQLRPLWLWSYRSSGGAFSHEKEGYLVYDDAGRPIPPEMCVDFVLDSYERAAGTWFRPRGQKPGRVVGALDFDTFGVGNRAGVLSFGKFAESRPELFEMRRLPEQERIPFGDRERFFAYLADRADEFRPGDVVAIQGLKRDGNIHQHAILLEDVDPVTGFACGLADQMKWPRRRTWEGIMGEAPRRSLLFHVRPKAELLLRLDPQHAADAGPEAAGGPQKP